MKKLVILFLYLINVAFAQEVFIDPLSKKEYVFLGSVKNNQQKFLTVNEKSINWVNSVDFQQIDRLSPYDFLDKIFSYHLVFKVSGDEPFWAAEISKNKLIFNADEGVEIVININKYSLDYNFLAMFHSKEDVYGVIHGLTIDSPCDTNFDEITTIFEVFINYRGEVFKGCATLEIE